MTTELAPAAPPRRSGPKGRSSDFGPLVARIKEADLLRHRPVWYIGQAVLITLMLTTLLGGLLAIGLSPVSPWWALLLTPFAALVSSQLSYFGHDTAHHQVTSNRRVRQLIGLVAGNLLTGLSYGWWNDKHSRHHANPNHDGLDPDVADGLISWTEQQQDSKHGLARWFGRHQALFFFPVLTLLGWSLQLNGIQRLKDRPTTDRRIEIALLVAHAVGTAAVLTWLLGPVVALVFVLAHHAIWGFILGMAFAPNHKGMAMPDGSVKLDHLRKQVLTSRNINSHPVVDYMMGGLNFQIEHHLFPAMPRPHLKRAAVIISSYCAEVGIPYRSCSVIDSYAECLAHLRAAGRGHATVGG